MASEIEKLKLLTVQVETLVDKELAHLDRKEFDSRVTFDDLNGDTLDEVACKYICLLTGKEYSTLKATVQETVRVVPGKLLQIEVERELRSSNGFGADPPTRGTCNRPW